MNIAEIVTIARRQAEANKAQLPDADLLIYLNAAIDEVEGDLIAQSRTWKFGDNNYTALPTGLKTLVDQQRDYALDVSWLTVSGVEVKNADGIWVPLDFVDWQTIEQGEAEYHKTAGMPVEYTLREHIMTLFPAPATASVTLTNGLKVSHQRLGAAFVVGDLTSTTKTPGFPSPYHILVPFKIAYNFSLEKNKPQAARLEKEIEKLSKKLFRFQANRHDDEPARIEIMTPRHR